MDAAGPLVEEGERGVDRTTELFAEFRLAAGNATTKMERLAQVVGDLPPLDLPEVDLLRRERLAAPRRA